MTTAHPAGPPRAAPPPAAAPGAAAPDLSLFPPSTQATADGLRVGGCLLGELAQRFGTPAYVIDETALRVGRCDHAGCAAGQPPGGRPLIAVPVTGAYCFTMASNYNDTLRPPVVMCGNGTARLAVRRETHADLMTRELG